jgi:hypothetical protein
MGPMTSMEPLHTSAPILDYDDEPRQTRPDDDDEMMDTPGVMTLAPEAFDAAILEALVSP